VTKVKTSGTQHTIKIIFMHMLAVDRAYYYIRHTHISDRLLYIHPFLLHVSFFFGIREYRISNFTYTTLSAVVCLEITAFSDVTCSLVDRHQHLHRHGKNSTSQKQ
jgi:hypothetical protein